MASHDYVVSNDTGANVRADINTALSAIVTHNSVSGTPASTFAHMIWADTSVTGSLFKVRNAANGASASLFTATGLIKPADGGLTDVAVGPSSDIDTGFHFATAATITMVTAGTARCTLSATATTFNASAADVDFIVGATGQGANSLFVQGSDGFVGLGIGAPANLLDIQRDGASTVQVSRADSNSSGPNFIGRKARGTHASKTALSSGDFICRMLAQAYHTTGTPGYATTADMVMFADGVESGDTVPTAMRFATMASGGSLTERMRITSAGLVGIGTAGAPAYGVLEVVCENASYFNVSNRMSTANAFGARVSGYKSRGTAASPADVSKEDECLMLYAGAYLNGDFRLCGIAGYTVDVTPAGSVIQSRWNTYRYNAAGTGVIANAVGCVKALTNNTATTVFSLTAAAGAIAACNIRYAVEVWNGTDLQVETGSVAVYMTNKAGAFVTAATKYGNIQSMTSGTLTCTWAVSSANPGVVSLNANSSLTPSATYPKLVYCVENLSDQALSF